MSTVEKDFEVMAHRLVEASGAPDERDLAYAIAGLSGIVNGLKARRAWSEHVGEILTPSQALDVAGWTRAALSKAVKENRVLRLTGGNGKYGYAAAGFTDAQPAKPISTKALLASAQSTSPSPILQKPSASSVSRTVMVKLS